MQTLRLSVTERCPLDCRFCYAEKFGRSLAVATIQEVIRQACDAGYEHLAIGGGEPLAALHETKTGASAGKHFGMTVAVTTSGLGLSKEVLRQLSDVDHFQLSLGAYRVNLLDAYGVLAASGRSFGVNLSLSPDIVGTLVGTLQRFEQDGAVQTTLLLPKAKVPPLSPVSFLRYLETLTRVKNRSNKMRIYTDCLTRRILAGRCEPEGTSFFPDLTVSRCAFGASKAPWRRSLTRAVLEAEESFTDCPLVASKQKTNIGQVAYS